MSKGISDDDKKYYVKNYKLTEYQINTYSLFVELEQNSKNDGILSFIIPNNWMTIKSNLNLRKFILNKEDINIKKFSEKVFKNADVDVAILMFSNLDEKNNKISIFKEKNKQVFLYAKNSCSILKDENFDFIINYDILEDVKIKKITEKIINNSKSLSPWFAKCKTGLKVYQKGKGDPKQTKETLINKPFHSNTKKNSKYYKYLEGNDVKRYQLEWSKMYLKYGRHLAEPRSLNYSQQKEF